MRVMSLGFCALACLASGMVGAAAPLRAPLPIAEVLKSPELALFYTLSLSADGEWAAYMLIDRGRVPVELDPVYVHQRRSGAPSVLLGGDIWIVPTRGGESRNVTNAQGNNWCANWSPDGSQLAFFSDRDGTAKLWVWERASGKSRAVSSAVAQGMNLPLWSPDGKTIVVTLLSEGVTLEQAASAKSGITPVTKAEGATAVVYRSTEASRVFGADSMGKSGSGFSMNVRPPTSDLAAIDVSSGAVRRLTRGQDASNIHLSPDGTRVAYIVQRQSTEQRSQQRFSDLMVVPLAGGVPRAVVSDVKISTSSFEIGWSPDNRYIAYPITGPTTTPQLGIVAMDGLPPRVFAIGDQAEQAGGEMQVSGRARAIPLWSADSAQVAIISADKIWRVRLAEGTAHPFTIQQLPLLILARNSSSRYVSPDHGRSALLFVRDAQTQREGLARLDLSTGKVKLLGLDAVRYGGYSPETGTDASADGRQVLYIREDASHAPDLWVSAPTTTRARRLTQISPVFDRYELGQSRLISWRGKDGQELRGALLLPPGHKEGDRHPMVVNVYAGSFLSGHVNRFGFDPGNVAALNEQMLATRGIAVLFPDEPLGRGDPMRELSAGIEAAVQQAVALGYADPKRLGIIGQSYGGYSTLSAIVTHPDLFAAAVERAGPGNLFSMYGAFDENGGNFGVGWSEEGQGRMDGTPWDQRDRYLNNSPLLFLDRAKTPLLIVHGTADTTVPPSETAQIFVAMRRLGKTVEYARYRGEDHWEGSWSAANQADFLDRVLRWFGHYLQGDTSTAP